jgi:hypothetical protein
MDALMALTEIGTTIVLIGAVLGVLSKWVVVPLFKMSLNAYKALLFIEHEVKFDSGRSVKDLAERTDLRIEYLFEHLGIEMPDNLRSPAPVKES